jgi:CoA:oxalate CoA-transferase
MTGQTREGPLAGLLILDLTRVLAGPYCSMQLAELGARVIKVERPGSGDDARAIGPFIGDRSAYFSSLNRGKESIALDLGDADDRRRFERLLAHADILLENFRPGAMERLGYGFEALHAKWPRLIYAAASGFGHTGPYSPRPAYDMVVQAMGGVMSLTGPEGGPPTRVGTSVGDITAGLFTAIGINAALYARSQSGLGQKIDVAMLDSQVAILENAIARNQATGEVPGPIGARHPSITPFGAFDTRDGAIVIAAGNDALFASLLGSLDRSALLDDPRFASNAARTDNQSALKVELETVLRGDSSAAWLERLEAAGVPCGPINDVAAVLADPQVQARNMLVSIEEEDGSILKAAGNPIKLSSMSDPTTRRAAPRLDAHRAALIVEFGLDED